jgi:hypothetical protein
LGISLGVYDEPYHRKNAKGNHTQEEVAMAYLFLRNREVWIGFTTRSGVPRRERTLLPALEVVRYKMVGGRRRVVWPQRHADFLRDFEYHLAHDNAGMGAALKPDFSLERLFKEFIASLPPDTPAKTKGGYETAKKHLVTFYPDPTMNFLSRTTYIPHYKMT